jgi:ribosome-binding factor A
MQVQMQQPQQQYQQQLQQLLHSIALKQHRLRRYEFVKKVQLLLPLHTMSKQQAHSLHAAHERAQQ